MRLVVVWSFFVKIAYLVGNRIRALIMYDREIARVGYLSSVGMTQEKKKSVAR
jgi:hypothetical protein